MDEEEELLDEDDELLEELLDEELLDEELEDDEDDDGMHSSQVENESSIDGAGEVGAV